MKKSYTKNYLQTYLWHGIAIVTNLLSMLIVVPLLTDNSIIFGVYSVCISTAIFLSYADLGFVSAGIKYAGESYARGDYTEELKFHGFSGFILFIFVAIISGVYFVFSYNPSLLIKDINLSEHLKIASSLLFIQAFFSFNTILQRFVTGVFQIRIEGFIFQRLLILVSIIKIASVYYFFGSEKYDIVGYFLFGKILEFFALIIGLYIINQKFDLSILKYFKAFKFDKSVFNKTKGLAFSSLFITLMWILYYELDVIMIGKLLGAKAVAVFALAFTFMKFLRSLSSVIFSPFQNRYNHFIGLNNLSGLKSMVKKVVLFAMPVIVLPVLSIVLLSRNLVLSWAGSEYYTSAYLLSFLAFNFMYSFIVIPGANMLTALVRIKEMYWINFVMVIVFWSGVFLTKNFLGVYAFAGFKLVSGTLAMLFYLRFLLGYLGLSLTDFLKMSISRIIIPVMFQGVFLTYMTHYLPDFKSKSNLLFVIAVGALGTFIGFLTLYLSSGYYKAEYNIQINRLLNRI